MITRRIALIGSAAAFFSPAFGQDSRSPPGMAKWMDQWMDLEKPARGLIFVGRFLEEIWFLTRAIEWEAGPGQGGLRTVQVPIGFVTDFASIPTAFCALLSPTGRYAWAAVVHDYLYWTQDRPREEADLVLKYAMEDLKIDTLTVAAIYQGVRLGGSSAWESNAKLKGAGEKRIIKLFPADPGTKWSDWKKRTDVFGP